MTKSSLKEHRKYSDDLPFRQGKRRLITIDELKIELKSEMRMLFSCFERAVDMYNNLYLPTVVPGQIVRNFEATVFNQCLVSSAFYVFRNNCRFGKYKRFYIKVGNCNVQFKKLNNKGLPMNINTRNVEGIHNQLALDLFGDGQLENPILFFGYQKNKIGELVNPQIVYLDNGEIQFTLSKSDFENVTFEEINVFHSDKESSSNNVRIKNNSLRKLAN